MWYHIFRRKQRPIRKDRTDLSAVALLNKQIRMQKYGM